MSIKIKDLKRETVMNLYRAEKSLDELQMVMHMAFPDLGFITTDVNNFRIKHSKKPLYTL
jgi:hypothetical protein